MELNVEDLLSHLGKLAAEDPRILRYTILMDGIGSSKFEVHHLTRCVRLGKIAEPKPRLESHPPSTGSILNSARGRMRL